MKLALGPVFALLIACSRAPSAATATPTATTTTTATASPTATPTPTPTATPPVSRLVVHLVPLGEIDDETVQQAAEGLRTHVPAIVVVEPRAALAPSTASSIKGRWRAEKILDWMENIASGERDAGGPQAAPGTTQKWMSLTDVDIVAQKGQNPNWGVLGLGNVDGRFCVLSTFRMRRKWENGGAPEDVVRDRLWKTAVHELGHTLGLPHCPHVGCIMEDAHGTVKTTDREVELCPDCARRFREASGRRAEGGAE